jgi:hypothetical protein
MCCYLEIADQILKTIVEAMHQTAAAPARQLVASNVLESEFMPTENTLFVDVKSEGIKQAIEAGSLAVPFMQAAQMINPEIKQVRCRVKSPILLSKLAPIVEPDSLP